MTNPRQLAPTVGLPHDGFEFLKGSFDGLKGYVVGRMTKIHRGKLYIDNAGWGPEADSIKYGYRVPFGGIHVFISKIGEPAPGRTSTPTSSKRLGVQVLRRFSPGQGMFSWVSSMVRVTRRNRSPMEKT